MLILIDGYNVIAPVAPPGRNAPSDWLHAERVRLLERLARQLDPVLAANTHVIFDSAGPLRRGSEAFCVQGIHVRFAVNHDEADDLIEELIAAHHFPKRLTVVSSDHRLQTAARRAGATAFDSQPWLDALLDGEPMLAIAWPPRPGTAEDQPPDAEQAKPEGVGQEEIGQWLSEFGISAESAEDVQPLAEPRPDDRDDERFRAGEFGRQTGQGEEPPNQDLPHGLPDGYNPFPEGYGEDLLP